MNFQPISENCARKVFVETGQKTHEKLSIGLQSLHTKITRDEKGKKTVYIIHPQGGIHTFSDTILN